MADLTLINALVNQGTGGGGTGGNTGGVDVNVDGETLVTQDGVAGFSVENETLICL